MKGYIYDIITIISTIVVTNTIRRKLSVNGPSLLLGGHAELALIDKHNGLDF